MVLSVLAALCTSVSAEVEHIPYVSRPHELTGEELLYKLLVVVCLIFLGVIALSGVGGMPVKRLTAVLGATDRDIGVGCVELIEPRSVHSGIATVPTEVVVVGNEIGDLDIGVVHLAHRNCSDGGKTGLIHLVNEVVEYTVVLEKVLGRAADRDLVGESPEEDGGVVVVLSYKLLHLRDSVLAAGGHMLGDIGDLCPDHKTLFIAEIIEILVVLIVSETDGGCANLHDIVNVLCVMLGKERVTNAPSVLVAGYAAERIFLTVEDKAVFGIDLEGTAAEAGANVIKNGLTLNDLYLTAVEVRILTAVPEVNVLKGEDRLLFRGLDLCDLVLFLVVNRIYELLTVSKIGGENVHGNGCIGALNRGGDHKTGAAVVIQVEMRLVDANQIYVTVKTAVEGEIRHLRINAVVGSVVNDDRDLGLVGKLFGNVYSPGRVTAVVVSKLLAANVYVCGGVCAAEFEVVKICLGKICLLERLYVEARAAEIVVSAVKSVLRVPGMRKGYKRAVACRDIGGVFLKKPILV